MLVHGGEVDRDRDLAAVREMIDREYVIDFVTSRRSSLTPLEV
jgi:hypothetical protein